MNLLNLPHILTHKLLKESNRLRSNYMKIKYKIHFFFKYWNRGYEDFYPSIGYFQFD